MPDLRVLMTVDYRDSNPYQRLLADGLAERNVDVQFPKGYRRGLPILRSALSIRPDVLHLHWATHLTGGTSACTRAAYSARLVAEVLALRAAGTRIVWTVHNLRSHDTAFPRIEHATRYALAKISHALIVHDGATAEKTQKLYNISPSKLHTVPHGHYQSLYPPLPPRHVARERLNLSEARRTFLYFGSLRPYKGVEDLLRAWEDYEAEHPDDLLIIAGKPLEESYGDLIRQRSASLSRVDLRMGFVDESDIPAFFSVADVAVFPFRRVTTSGSVVLAMSFGLPILAPAIDTLQATLQNADDLLFPLSSPRHSSIYTALEASNKRNLSSIGKRTLALCESIGWDEISRRTVQVYTR